MSYRSWIAIAISLIAPVIGGDNSALRYLTGKDYVIVGTIRIVVILYDAHASRIVENLRFSNFPKRRPRGRAAGNSGY
jgi:hypothetical protein